MQYARHELPLKTPTLPDARHRLKRSGNDVQRFVSIRQASEILGVSMSSLRRWEAEGRISAEYTAGGHRRYDLSRLNPELFRKARDTGPRTLAYARVTSAEQVVEWERQETMLTAYCAKKGWEYEFVTDLGSGTNYQNKGLKRIIEEIALGRINRLVITNPDRLLMVGVELVLHLCEVMNVEVVILDDAPENGSEADLSADIAEILSMLRSRLYAIKSYRNKCLLDGIQNLLADVAR